MREPNGSVHSFDRCWTTIAEDPFLSLPSASETPATEDASLFDTIQKSPLNADESSSYPNFQSEAPQPDYDTFNGLDPQFEAEGALSFGLSLDDGSPNPDSESSVAYNIDLDYHFDHSQPSFSFSDRPVTTPHDEFTPAGLTSSETSSMSKPFHLRCLRLSIRILLCQTPCLWIHRSNGHLPVICSHQMILNLDV